MNASPRLVRAVVGIVLPVFLLAATLLPLFLFRDRLPDPIATHWGWDTQPNDSMTLIFLVIFQLLFAGIPAAVMAFVSRRNPAYRGEISPAVAITAFAAAMNVIVGWQIVGANLDASDWTQAGPVGFAKIAGALVGAAAVAVGATFLARSLETARPPVPEVPSAGLGPGTRAVWVGTARAPWAAVLVVAFLGAGIVVALVLHPAPALAFVLIGITGLGFTSIRVIADRHGVCIVYGAFGWPTQRIPIADIRQASMVNVVPMQRGGWGYRGSLRLFRRAAVVLRAGDGIQLDLMGGRTLVITVDGARNGAGVINDLVVGAVSEP